jgi:hypothetical protein
MDSRISRILALVLIVVVVGTCALSRIYLSIEINAPPVATATPTKVLHLYPAVQTEPDTGWALLQPGLERRVISIHTAEDQLVESVYIWRLDQEHFRLDVAFDETPKSLETWQAETDAALVVNGGYFSITDETYFPNGLTVIDGEATGSSYYGFGGMLAIQESGAELRWLVPQPYEMDEPLQAALQSFPVLVKPGGVLGFEAEQEDYKKARRTAIGQDWDGRILLIVAPQGYFTLHELSVFLTESDLDLEIALNLDGGGSTGILVANRREVIPPRTPLPFVILVFPR